MPRRAGCPPTGPISAPMSPRHHDCRGHDAEACRILPLPIVSQRSVRATKGAHALGDAKGGVVPAAPSRQSSFRGSVDGATRREILQFAGRAHRAAPLMCRSARELPRARAPGLALAQRRPACPPRGRRLGRAPSPCAPPEFQLGRACPLYAPPELQLGRALPPYPPPDSQLGRQGSAHTRSHFRSVASMQTRVVGMQSRRSSP